ncbi:zinc ribbon domain-containing protein [Shewanella avicenniae]|uniref:Zinc ribbon domain-containing protein n=1 Tax=Shewanella avicenniae TaxID=2814294 RepID=A0ABX7QN81_9GAMM|nr:zinc ribbon domain-containing protein [Shewanella avicenniae]
MGGEVALIKCSECGRDISDKAMACPGCGWPLPNAVNANPVRVKRSGAKWEFGGFILICSAIVAAIAGSNHFAVLAGFSGLVIFIIGRIID